MEVHLDFRETSLYDELIALGVHPIKKPLELGDVHIVGETVHLVFERKTKADLASSIVDGRYTEQKARLMACFPPSAVMYIIEDYEVGCGGAGAGGGGGAGGTSSSAMDGAIIHTMYRDGMHVMCTRGVEGTAALIQAIAAKATAKPQHFSALGGAGSIEGGGSGGAGTAPAVDYAAVVKLKSKKIANIDKPTCYVMQLCQIPGISHKIAKAIATAYPTYKQLLDALCGVEGDKARLGLLKQIDMIADKKARSILEYVL